MRPSLKRLVYFGAFLTTGVVALSALTAVTVGVSAARTVAEWLLLGAALLFALGLLALLFRTFLWRVGRRLAFSYFLIGVLPIPMVALLVLLNGYLLAGYFLGHLYRDAQTGLRTELTAMAEARRSLVVQEAPPPATTGAPAFAYYRGGRRFGGDPRLPDRWPEWLPGPEPGGDSPGPAFVALDDQALAVIGAAGGPRLGVLALFADGLEEELSRRAGVRVRLLRADDPRKESVLRLQVLGREFALATPTTRGLLARPAADDPSAEPGPWLDRPLLWWGAISGPLPVLADGSLAAEFVTASLNASPRTVTGYLFSGSAEVDAAVWAGMISITSLLATVYALALTMALVLIFTLSRAVNRLSRATSAVRAGDFSVRIPVRRRDQIGELQRSFNEMAQNLEQLVATAAQKELLEKELQIARDLQKSLLPADLPSSRTLEFATLFEPSAAIGGDYFDVLGLDRERLTVVIADVSGHGLPAGLRMAMLKAALVILVEEVTEPREILRRLDALLRSGPDRRLFVTATLAMVDPARGRLELTNAGHPPTYLVRDGRVREILLPGHPLGTLGDSYGHESFELESGDFVVWLSDGLIEASDRRGEPFGYERVRTALAAPADSAADLRNGLLEAVRRHTDGRPAEDDKTLVAMRYRAEEM